MLTDIEIAQSAKLHRIEKIAEKIQIPYEELEPYGKYKAKVPLHFIDNEKVKKSRLILVSAISPTPAGEGKTTTSIGLSEALNYIGKKTIVVLREPSLGPVFGIKGGATGGGYSQVVPMEDINLHFTGDISAVEKAHNLLSALIDNNLQNKAYSLNIDPRTVLWKRVMDMNDRALRKIIVGLGGTANSIPRETGFDITVASEVMAILCLSQSISELKERFANILVGFTRDKKPVFGRDLKAQGAMAVLMKDAIRPNLVQTLEGNPAFIHGGPFANIAQGTNSIIATKMAMSLADYVVTEAGFGFDLGAEKFLNIKCPVAQIAPHAIVIVVTVRALKYHGGVNLKDLKHPNPEAVNKGSVNLEKHLENAKKYGVPTVVAINAFPTDTTEEYEVIQEVCKKMGVQAVGSYIFAEGGKGGVDLANAVLRLIDEEKCNYKPLYDWKDSVEKKIYTICSEIYGAKQVNYTSQALKDLQLIQTLGYEDFPICMAKTQYSFSDDPQKLGKPEHFDITVREIAIASGARFLIPITGEIMRMPGLPSVPSAESIDIDNQGVIKGLF
ncbi:MAG: formate--tetrahydrofolate ligase [Bacteroidia bacterium]|nr:MAG: formate--tetrahydrofolate ligase [Bacteroidia bacterium]